MGGGGKMSIIEEEFRAPVKGQVMTLANPAAKQPSKQTGGGEFFTR
jgi:hypothetical protein